MTNTKSSKGHDRAAHSATEDPAHNQSIIAPCPEAAALPEFAEQNPPKTESIKHITQDTDDENEYVYSVKNQGKKQPPTCQLQIEGKTVDMMIDSGASVNLIDETTFQVINNHRDKILEQTNNRIYPYESMMPLFLLGTITANIEGISTKAQLHVVKGNTGNQDLCQCSYHHKQERPRIPTRRIQVPIWRNRESDRENDPLAHRS